MIHNIIVDNVNWGLSSGIKYLLDFGKEEDSRNGPVLVAPVPVCTTYVTPTQRVLFSPKRDANPFLHFMESLWILQGRDDVAWVAKFAGNMRNYSDNGETLHGAYGKRIRSWFKVDQLKGVIAELKRNANTRRAMLGMWDPGIDLIAASLGSKDVPCNTHIYFSIRLKELDMFVSCRSNDIIWGAYGANAVHFSFLHEYVAACVGVNVGLYRQLSYNFHAYLKTYPKEKLKDIAEESKICNDYSSIEERALVSLAPLKEPEFSQQVAVFMENPLGPPVGTEHPILRTVARPMYRAFAIRTVNPDAALEAVSRIEAPDWRRACGDWIRRRQK